MVALKSIKLTVDEYVKMEQEHHQKYEFHFGEIFAMAGGSINHGKIGLNVAASLKTKLRGSKCKPYNSDVKVSMENGNRFVYPDAFVVCGELETEPKQKDSIKNPKVIFEVLSKSTMKYDKGKKFEFYRSIEILEEYVLIDQEEIYVEVYKREKELWKITSYNNLEDIVLLQSINTNLTIKEIYEDVKFEEKPKLKVA